MRHHPSVTAAREESASQFTAALVLALFGVLSGIESSGWLVTTTLFLLATVAGINGLVLRYSKPK
jgi:hypothetical protein